MEPTLPYGVFRTRAGGGARVGARFGGTVLDLEALAARGLLDVVPDAQRLFASSSLNAFMAAGPDAWRACRQRLLDLVERRDPIKFAVHAEREVQSLLPIAVGDFVDFYSSRIHATNGGRIMRPDGEPLSPNWTHLPVGYHGRTGSIVVSGTPVRRPWGQSRDAAEPGPRFGPSRKLDFELELGFVIGRPSAPGRAVTCAEALDHVFGVVLLNDWSARDIQAWESRPLGPFLGKAFATSISAWVTPLDALRGRCLAPADVQEPEPLQYLRGDRSTLDIRLEVALRPNGSDRAETITRASGRHLYWTVEQQIAHLTSGGARLRVGDLLGSGAISGPTRDSRGSLLELTWGGESPIELSDGTRRRFLEDGDEVILRADGLADCRGQVVPAADRSPAVPA